jgi:hypothetical protein
VTPSEGGQEAPSTQRAAKDLELDSRVTGRLRAATGERERYLLKLDRDGVLQIAVSWQDQEGLDRILLQRGATAPIESLTCRGKLRVEQRLPVQSGFYYLELVPGQEDTSYDMVVTFTPGPS